MKRLLLIAAACLATGTASAAAAAQGPPGAQPADSGLESAHAAIAELDMERLERDRDYALATLGHLDILDESIDDSEGDLAIDTLRMIALSTTREPERIRSVVDRVLTYRSSDPEVYRAAWWSALSIPDLERAVSVLEMASRRIAGVRWAELREGIGEMAPGLVLSQLDRDDRGAERLRLAEALFRIGWSGDGGAETSDFLRMILLEDRLEKGDTAAAADLAAGLSTPTSVLSLVALRRYDAVLAPNADRASLLRTAVEALDRQTADALGDGTDPARVFNRLRFLRSVGREREALGLAEPFMRDVAGATASHHLGMWIINESVNALLRLGRTDDAVRLMEQLVTLPVAENGELIGPYINHSMVLLEAGRPAEALAYATTLDRDFAQHANGFGRMWIASSIVCSLAALNRGGEAEPTLARLRQAYDDNPSALIRAYLCLDDLDAAEAVIIRRLESDEPDAMVLALQDYRIRAESPAAMDFIFEKLERLRERPAVGSALERVGRVLEPELSLHFWGGV